MLICGRFPPFPAPNWGKPNARRRMKNWLLVTHEAFCEIILDESNEALDWAMLISSMPDFLLTMICDTRFLYLQYG